VATFCDNCRRERNWPKPAVRTSKEPCQFCGGYDAYDKRKMVNGQPKVKRVRLNNFTHDNRLLVGMPEEAALQKPFED